MMPIITLMPSPPVFLRVQCPEWMVGGSAGLILMKECRGGERLLMLMRGILLLMLTTRPRLKWWAVELHIC